MLENIELKRLEAITSTLTTLIKWKTCRNKINSKLNSYIHLPNGNERGFKSVRLDNIKGL